VQTQAADVGASRRSAGNRANEALPVFVLLSRIVLALMGMLLLIMPWSERYSQLDNFPRGQDTELGLLMLLMSVGVALLFAWSRNTAFRAWLAIAFVSLSMANFSGPPGLRLAHVRGVSGSLARPAPGSPPGAFEVPLQI
jgi:hypothetical protein